MIVVCTACSREKRHDPGFLPAKERYLGLHIQVIAEAAERHEVPLFILSGAFGLLPAHAMIPDYEHLLGAGEVYSLAVKVVGQIRDAGISEVVFFKKSKPMWEPYTTVIRLATSAANIRLEMHELHKAL
jgi:hypothetical protein